MNTVKINLDDYYARKAKFDALGVRYFSLNTWLRGKLDPLCWTGASKVGPLTKDDYAVTINDCGDTATWQSKICAYAWFEGQVRAPAMRIRNRAKRICRLIRAGERIIDSGDGYTA